ncbi:MAG: AzlD domain-containing protein [Clostridia bacterium]|nr:AzlD domain-containing protein [Clostridia bacterium]
MVNTYLYLLVMAAVTFAVRALPLTLLRRQIKNRFVQSFLFYVPYVTLAVMTFPAILHATGSQLSGLLALGVGVVTAWLGADLFKVSVSCCAVVLIAELFLL